ncbi:hypothetical protein KL919_004487 [Ogataea angusta]|nr:hypothetical protein KL919_004487 [Ogataea angusta]
MVVVVWRARHLERDIDEGEERLSVALQKVVFCVEADLVHAWRQTGPLVVFEADTLEQLAVWPGWHPFGHSAVRVSTGGRKVHERVLQNADVALHARRRLAQRGVQNVAGDWGHWRNSVDLI